MAFYAAMSWHPGEDEIHRLTRVPNNDNPTHPTLPPHLARRIALSPLIALGTTDLKTGEVWTTLWGGPVPTAQPVARGGIIGARSNVDAEFDPVVRVLYEGKGDGEVIQEQDPSKGKMVSGLSILLEERDRVKFFGRMLAGAVSMSETDSSKPDDEETKVEGQPGRIGNAQLVMQVTQSLGNCPKYLNKKVITPFADAKPRLISKNPRLGQEAIDLINQADLFFVSSKGPEDMDTNHRGGSPGFIRVQQPADAEKGTVLVWPEYSGNNLYQTLGNFMHDDHAGICIPNFDNGDVLYLTGHAKVLLNDAAADVIAKTRLAVSFSVTGARFVKNGLSFRGKNMDDKNDGRSPYNPRIRFLQTEKTEEFPGQVPNENQFQPAADVTAKLIKKTQLTPSIYRYRFALSDATALGPWQPGQYVALDFGDELYNGYTHMNDNDPQSLNDDFLRTFTVASPPGKFGIHGEEFEMVIRKVGTVTGWLTWQREGHTELGVRGFGGEFRFDSKNGAFIAAGIGITPLLGQIGVVENLPVLWTVNVKDVGLVTDVLKEFSDTVKSNTTLFLTGDESGLDDQDKEQIKSLDDAGLKVMRRRLTKEDLVALKGKVDDWYLCTAPAMRLRIQEWLPGKVVHFENFDY